VQALVDALRDEGAVRTRKPRRQRRDQREEGAEVAPRRDACTSIPAPARSRQRIPASASSCGP